VKTASNVPESARLCLSSMLKAIMASRNGQSHQAHYALLVSLDLYFTLFLLYLSISRSAQYPAHGFIALQSDTLLCSI
jgi:hypothetical protein